jgi:hypothetical protein
VEKHLHVPDGLVRSNHHCVVNLLGLYPTLLIACLAAEVWKLGRYQDVNKVSHKAGSSIQ